MAIGWLTPPSRFPVRFGDGEQRKSGEGLGRGTGHGKSATRVGAKTGRPEPEEQVRLAARSEIRAAAAADPSSTLTAWAVDETSGVLTRERRTEGTTSAAAYFGALAGGGKEVTRLASNLNISAALQGGADL